MRYRRTLFLAPPPLEALLKRHRNAPLIAVGSRRRSRHNCREPALVCCLMIRPAGCRRAGCLSTRHARCSVRAQLHCGCAAALLALRVSGGRGQAPVDALALVRCGSRTCGAASSMCAAANAASFVARAYSPLAVFSGESLAFRALSLSTASWPHQRVRAAGFRSLSSCRCDSQSRLSPVRSARRLASREAHSSCSALADPRAVALAQLHGSSETGRLTAAVPSAHATRQIAGPLITSASPLGCVCCLPGRTSAPVPCRTGPHALKL